MTKPTFTPPWIAATFEALDLIAPPKLLDAELEARQSTNPALTLAVDAMSPYRDIGAVSEALRVLRANIADLLKVEEALFRLLINSPPLSPAASPKPGDVITWGAQASAVEVIQWDTNGLIIKWMNGAHDTFGETPRGLRILPPGTPLGLLDEQHIT